MVTVMVPEEPRLLHVMYLREVEDPYKPNARGIVHPVELQDTVTVPPRYAVDVEAEIEREGGSTLR